MAGTSEYDTEPEEWIKFQFYPVTLLFKSITREGRFECIVNHVYKVTGYKTERGVYLDPRPHLMHKCLVRWALTQTAIGLGNKLECMSRDQLTDAVIRKNWMRYVR